jgi:hypothetical protein
MSRPNPRERYETCGHRDACDRMARLANLMIWFAQEGDPNESVADAYRCELCKQWKWKGWEEID